jgi:carbon-monoxide dehydrogenase small subunit
VPFNAVSAPGHDLIGCRLLENNPAPSKGEIQKGISGNLCRCTGYLNIVEAIHSAAAESYRGT